MGLDLDVLRRANLERNRTGWRPLTAWSPMEWACAAAGEMGEACNVAKKLQRLEITPAWNAPGDQDAAELTRRLGEEVSDTILYLDLLAARCGIDLSEAIRRKFNATSAKVGSSVTLS